MTWMQTRSGQAVDLLEPRPETILLGDLAWHLARIARFAGATSGELPWNVAQHSLLVESLMPEDASPSDRLAALLHDAHEAYMGDLISPLTMAMDKLHSDAVIPSNQFKGPSASRTIGEIKKRLDAAIHAAFGLSPSPSPSPSTLKRVADADFLALRVERAALMVGSPSPWEYENRPGLPAMPDPLPALRPAHPPARAMEVFLDRFRILQDERHGILHA